MAAQAEATREAAAKQWQPLVYCHQRRGPDFGPAELGYDDVIGEVVRFHYYLSNEGLGPALNIVHGIELDGEQFLFGARSDAGFQFRTCRAGEFLPPLQPDSREPVPARSIPLDVPNERYWRDEGGRKVGPQPLYFCRFESLFGERWETRNPPDPTAAPEIRRL